MPPIYSLLIAMRMMGCANTPGCIYLPEHSLLHIRLTAPVGSFASRPGSPLQGVLIAPVRMGTTSVLPAGAVVTGEVRSVRRVGLGLVHETASLDLNFDSVSIPGGGEAAPVSTRVISVDNGREEVTPSGSIREIRTTGSMGNRAAHLMRVALLSETHAQMAIWAVKSVLTQVPEPEIFLPTGAELTLTLNDALRGVATTLEDDGPRALTADERSSLAPVVEMLPDRTEAQSGRPSDLVNFIFIGSRGEIAAAFRAAGWTEARPSTARSRVRSAFAVVQGQADRNAPMSALLVNDAPADMSWQKGFNDVSKRHHIRLWRQGETDTRLEIWIGAASRDIDYAYLRPGNVVTHQVSRQVDREREKVVNDLAFTGCADVTDSWDRPDVPRTLRNATGDMMETDGRLAIVVLNHCKNPAGTTLFPDTLPVHGNAWQVMLRREILGVRSDLIRHNIYWRGFEGLRFLVVAIQHKPPAEPDTPPEKTLASRFTPDWMTSVVSVH